MALTITDEIFDTAERLLRLSPAEWRSQLWELRQRLRGRTAEPEFFPDQHARAHALIERITAVLDAPTLRRKPKNTI